MVIFDEIENCTFFYGVSRMDNVGDAGTIDHVVDKG